MTTALTPLGSPLFIPGTPAPQGSKRHIGRGRMVESSAAVEGRADHIVSRHWCMAEAAVDALGDLLPTGVEWGVRNTGGGAMVRDTRAEAEADRDRMIRVAGTEIAWEVPAERFDRIEQRYTTGWVQAL